MTALTESLFAAVYADPGRDDRVVPLEALFTAPAMRSLRVLHNISSNIALAIEKSATPPPLVEISRHHFDRKDTDQLGEAGLRGVRRLVVSSTMSVDRIAWLWTCPLWPRREAITLTGYHSEPLDSRAKSAGG